MRHIPDNVLSAMKTLSEAAISFNSNIAWNKPQSLAEVFLLMKKHPQHFLRAGGTGTFKKFQDKKHDVVIDISSIKELKNLSLTENKLTIGAGVTFTQLLKFLDNAKSSSFLTIELYQVGMIALVSLTICCNSFVPNDMVDSSTLTLLLPGNQEPCNTTGQEHCFSWWNLAMGPSWIRCSTTSSRCWSFCSHCHRW